MFQTKRKLFALSFILALLLVGIFLYVGTASATGPLPPGTCGNGVESSVNGIAVKKVVNCEKSRKWTWDILKSADQSSVTLSEGQQLLVNYMVEVNATPVDTQFKIDGWFYVYNRNNNPVTIDQVSDNLAAVECVLNDNPVSFPKTLNANTLMVCTYAASLDSAVTENVVTVKSGEDTVIATSPIEWKNAAGSEIDKCVDVSDTFAGFLGTVCADTHPSFTFSYSRWIGSYDVCGDYTVDNTATFSTFNTGTSGSSSKTVLVKVPCAGGCTLTPGYWKTHSEYGPAPEDEAWYDLGDVDHDGGSEGPDETFFFSGKTYYQVLWTNPRGGNAYFILAHAYIAARLNIANGASSTAAVNAAMAGALEYFHNPASDGTAPSGALRAQLLDWADTLDDYNNGLIGPGHCSE